MVDTPHWSEQIEPLALTANTHSPPDTALVSIAVSMKRIADALEGTAFADNVANAIAHGIDTGALHAINNWVRSR